MEKKSSITMAPQAIYGLYINRVLNQELFFLNSINNQLTRLHFSVGHKASFKLKTINN